MSDIERAFEEEKIKREMREKSISQLAAYNNIQKWKHSNPKDYKDQLDDFFDEVHCY